MNFTANHSIFYELHDVNIYLCDCGCKNLILRNNFHENRKLSIGETSVLKDVFITIENTM